MCIDLSLYLFLSRWTPCRMCPPRCLHTGSLSLSLSLSLSHTHTHTHTRTLAHTHTHTHTHTYTHTYLHTYIHTGIRGSCFALLCYCVSNHNMSERVLTLCLLF